nr:helix-turn-helix domain-containing protein [Desulfopila inferna]
MDVKKFRKNNAHLAGLPKYSDALSSFEQDYFATLLQRNRNNVERAAEKAEVNVATLYRKIKKYNLR